MNLRGVADMVDAMVDDERAIVAELGRASTFGISA
jgi:hypothetical protein